MLNHKNFKIYFKVLWNCKKQLLGRIRTHHNTSKFTPIAQIIFGKPDPLFIDGQIQLCKEYFYPVTIKSLLEIVLFRTLFAKKGLVINATCQRLVSLRFSNSKSKALPFINHERSADESISEYFSQIFANRTIH